MLLKKEYLSNLYSCIRHLGNQHYNHKQQVHHSVDRTRLDHKMENSQARRLELEKKKLLSVIKKKYGSKTW